MGKNIYMIQRYKEEKSKQTAVNLKNKCVRNSLAVRVVTDESYMTSFSIGWSQHQLHHTTGATHIDFDGIPFAAGKKQTLPGRRTAKCTFSTPYIQTMSYLSVMHLRVKTGEISKC